MLASNPPMYFLQTASTRPLYLDPASTVTYLLWETTWCDVCICKINTEYLQTAILKRYGFFQHLERYIIVGQNPYFPNENTNLVLGATIAGNWWYWSTYCNCITCLHKSWAQKVIAACGLVSIRLQQNKTCGQMTVYEICLQQALVWPTSISTSIITVRNRTQCWPFFISH
jgi:hypothetical protein